jgi:hypothetical protein
MDQSSKVVGNHVRFFPKGEAFTVPSAGTASKTEIPGAADTGWLSFGPIVDLSVERGKEEKEVWGPKTGGGRLVLHDVAETKNDLMHRFTAQELSPLVMSVLYGSDLLDEASTDYTALDGEVKKGWIEVKQYDQDDALINTVYSFVHLKIDGAVGFGADLVTAQFVARQLFSTLNEGTLAV